MWDALTYPCLRYLLLVPKSSNTQLGSSVIKFSAILHAAKQGHRCNTYRDHTLHSQRCSWCNPVEYGSDLNSQKAPESWVSLGVSVVSIFEKIDNVLLQFDTSCKHSHVASFNLWLGHEQVICNPCPNFNCSLVKLVTTTLMWPLLTFYLGLGHE